MYFDPLKTKSYIQSLIPLGVLAQSLGIEIFVIPDFLSIPLAQQLLNLPPTLPHSPSSSTPTTTDNTISSSSSASVSLGAQDCFWSDSGPYTGEISPLHLSHFGVKFVELGHAERRRLFFENDSTVALKATAVCKNEMVPLVCIGELLNNGVEAAVDEVRPQIESLLAAIPGNAEVVLAYEPVWAIGKPEPAGAEYVVGVTKRLREIAEGYLVGGREKRTGEVRILYGGSAGPGLFEKLKQGVDGLFLGRFGHDVANFEAVMRELVL